MISTGKIGIEQEEAMLKVCAAVGFNAEVFLGGSSGFAYSALNRKAEYRPKDIDLFVKLDPRFGSTNDIVSALNRIGGFCKMKAYKGYKKDFFKFPNQYGLIKATTLSNVDVDIILLKPNADLMECVAADISKIYYKVINDEDSIVLKPHPTRRDIVNRLLNDKVCHIQEHLVLNDKFLRKIENRCRAIGVRTIVQVKERTPPLTINTNTGEATFAGTTAVPFATKGSSCGEDLGILSTQQLGLTIMSPEQMIKWNITS